MLVFLCGQVAHSHSSEKVDLKFRKFDLNSRLQHMVFMHLCTSYASLSVKMVNLTLCEVNWELSISAINAVDLLVKA